MRISDWSSDVFSSDLWKIILPLSLPGLISAGIFAFTLSWNEFIYALAFISSSENKTVAVGVLTELVEGDVYHWGSLMAGALFGSLPVAILYSFFVDSYVASLRSEEHTSELQSLMRISYAVFCLKKKTQHKKYTTHI